MSHCVNSVKRHASESNLIFTSCNYLSLQLLYSTLSFPFLILHSNLFYMSCIGRVLLLYSWHFHYIFLLFEVPLFTFRGINAKTPEFFEDLFCNLSCYEEYRVRTSSRSLRQVRTGLYQCIYMLKELYILIYWFIWSWENFKRNSAYL